jgi:hypothetical protein
MAVQYTAQASIRIGGAGSGSLNIGAKGPTKTIFTGCIIAAKFLFHVIGELVPGNHVPFTTGPKSRLVISINANAETRKVITNLVLDILILLSFGVFKSTLKFKVK